MPIFGERPAGGEYYVFRDPVHNLIEIDNEREGQFIRRTMATFEFQRMRRIRQNGLTNYVYDGLEATRFPHALGSFHVASRVVRSLMIRQPSPQEGFPDALALTEDDCQAFALAAALHDIGHGPLSHLWEEAFDKGETPRHEVYGHLIVDSRETEIGLFLSDLPNFEHYRPIVNAAKRFLRGQHRLSHLTHLLAGNLDIDRIDFMERDAHNAGVIYGLHEMDWLIRSFRFARLNKPNASWIVGIDGRKGLNALVQFVRARHAMYEQVYFHKTVRAATVQFKRVLARAAYAVKSGLDIPLAAEGLRKQLIGVEPSLVEYINLDDGDIWDHFKKWRLNDRDPVLARLCADFLSRRFFKAIAVPTKRAMDLLTAMDAMGDNNNLAQIVAQRMECSLSDARYYYGLDRTTFNVIGKYKDDPMETVWIIEKGRNGETYTPLHEFWRLRTKQDLEMEFRFIVVHEDCLASVGNLVRSLSHTADMKEAISPPPPYKLLAPLGKEGVWKETYAGVSGAAGGSVCALKAYKAAVEEDKLRQVLERDVTRIRTLLPNGHQNLAIPAYIGKASDRHWLSEPIWTGSLLDLLTDNGPLRNISEIAVIGRDLFSGLAALHDNKLRHTDLKPDNCGYIEHGSMKRVYVIGDFGCLSGRPNEVPGSLWRGTLRTRAPELFDDYNEISLAADVWALSATMYAICTGSYPLMPLTVGSMDPEERRQREAAMAGSGKSKAAEFMIRAGAELPAALWDVLSKGLAERGIRADASTVLAGFDDLLRESKGSAAFATVWQRTEDIIYAMGREHESGQPVDEALATEFAMIERDLHRYVPPSLLGKVRLSTS